MTFSLYLLKLPPVGDTRGYKVLARRILRRSQAPQGCPVLLDAVCALVGDFMATSETAAVVADYLVQANIPYQSSMLMCMGMMLGVVIIALIFKR